MVQAADGTLKLADEVCEMVLRCGSLVFSAPSSGKLDKASEELRHGTPPAAEKAVDSLTASGGKMMLVRGIHDARRHCAATRA